MSYDNRRVFTTKLQACRYETINARHLFRWQNQLRPVSRGNGHRNKQINLYDLRLLCRKQTFTLKGSGLTIASPPTLHYLNVILTVDLFRLVSSDNP